MNKVLSRVASPAGFALVLLLFFVLPFMSVSCEVPGAGSFGVNYSGTNLVTGSDPSTEVSPELSDAFEQLGGTAPGTESSEDEAPDTGTQILAILAAVVILFGVATFLIPRLKARLFGAAAAAGVGLVLTVVTLLVGESNLKDALTDRAGDAGVSESGPDLPDLDTLVDDMIGGEIGFWLVAIGLGLLLVGNLGAAVFGGRIRMPARAGTGAGAAVPSEPPTTPANVPTVDPLTGQPPAEQQVTPPPADPPPAPPADPPQPGTTPS